MFGALLFHRSVMSDSLQPHGLQHARLPCSSLLPRVCSNSCPLSWNGCPAAGALGAVDWVWHKPSWRRSPLTHHRTTGTYTRLGKQALGGHKWNPVYTRTQEKGAVTPRETAPRLPVSVQESLAEAWVSGGLLWGRGHWVWQHMPRTFWRRSLLSSLPPP